MRDFSSAFHRERFLIEDVDGATAPIVAMSNRVVLTLTDYNDHEIETIVIRGQMLHTVVRLAGSVLNMFQRTGSIVERKTPVDWVQTWEMAAGTHERTYNPDLWVAIYSGGKVVFQRGDHHNFLDVAEQCAAQKKRDYEESLRFAEQLFNKAGKPVIINHEANVAATFQIQARKGRAALIMRGAHKKTTFVFQGGAKGKEDINPVHFINAAAAYLEGIQLSFAIGSGNEKLRREMFGPYSDEGVALSSARARLGEIAAAIRTFEEFYDISYRPEKPNFPELIINAENMTKRRLDEEEYMAIKNNMRKKPE